MSKKRFSLKEWEDLNYCEHCFYDDESPLSDSDVVVLMNKQQALINALKKENKELKEDLKKGFDVPIPYVENSMRRLRAEHKVDEQQDTIRELRSENMILKNKIEDLRGSLFILNKELERQIQRRSLDE